MDYPLAVFTKDLDGLSETFIRRHIEQLLPGRTAVVVEKPYDQNGRDCDGVHPVLGLEDSSKALRWKLFRYAARRLRGEELADKKAILRHFLRKHKVRVVLGEYLHRWVPFLEVARSLNIKCFSHAHGYDVSQKLREEKWRREYLRYEGSAGVIVPSEVMRQKLLELGLSEKRVHVVPYGVDVPAQGIYRVEKKVVRCLVVGRMVNKKAPILTLDAFGRAYKVCPELRLDYVGEGTLLLAAEHFVEVSGLKDVVTLHGGQPHRIVKDLMRRADIFVQHSVTDPVTGDEEGLPVAILEGMAHSLPVVSTRHAGIPEAVVDGVTGYLVDEGESRGMSEHIVALTRDARLRGQMGSAGWKRAAKLFSWEKERAALLRILGLEAMQ